MRAASRRTTHPTRPTRRGQTSPAVPYIDVASLSSHVATLLHSRWPGLDPRDYTWRTVARYCREREAGPRPANLAVWVRSTLYGIIVDDQRADRGVDHHHTELNILLRELARPTPKRIRSALVERAVGHLHPRDVIIVRLVLRGHHRSAVATRLGVPITEVDRAYGRTRARLRAVIGSDTELRQALRRAARESAQVLPARPEAPARLSGWEIGPLTRLAETAAGVA